MRVGLAGYSVGRTIHAPLITAAGGQIVAVATSAPERVALVERELPAAAIVPDLDGLLARDDLDLVVLTTPTGSHVAHVDACITAGRACVVDKPMATNGDDAAAVTARAAAAGVPLTVFQNRRFDPGQLTLGAVLREGSLGQVLRFEMRWERWRPEPLRRWREQLSAAEGGGIVLDLQSHLVDAAVCLFGPVRSVFAQIHSVSTVADDDSFLVLEHVSGATSHLSATSLAALPGPRTRVLGTAAAYVLDEFEGSFSFPDLRDSSPEFCGWLYGKSERTPVTRAPGSAVDFYTQVAAALASPDPQALMPVQPSEAVAVLRILDAARVSSATGQVVSLPVENF